MQINAHMHLHFVTEPVLHCVYIMWDADFVASVILFKGNMEDFALVTSAVVKTTISET